MPRARPSAPVLVRIDPAAELGDPVAAAGRADPRRPAAGVRSRPAENLAIRRARVIVPTILLAGIVAWVSIEVTSRSAPTALDWLLCGLFVLAMSWEGIVLSQVSLGFWTWLRGQDTLSSVELSGLTSDAPRGGRSRTAVVIAIFDEDVDAVFAGVAVMRRSLARLGPTDDIDLHVLSDSRDPATVAAEERAVAAARTHPDGPAILYRRRGTNDGRKAGNIAEFLERTRGAYAFMIVLDADSLMSGVAMRTLVRLMEEHPRVALIQTISYAAGRRTLFARIQQFAVRLHAPLSLRAMAHWQGPDGLYYGHNAIIRCEPFLEHAKLPVLPGRPPLGGEILCHDVVEAALLCRAGWQVRVVPDLEGTWEEMPTNVVDLLGRERRWCQGNLQHARVFAMSGLTAGSRAHIALGIAAYLTAPLWWVFLLLGALRVALDPTREGLGILAYGATERGPFAAALLGLAALFLFGPRVLNVLRALGGRRERIGFGGGFRLLASAAAEQLFSMLLTPTLSLVNSGFVLQTLGGRVVAWTSQSRADRAIGWREAARVLRLNLAIGAALAVAAGLAGGWYALWMAPTVAGLLLGPALVAWSSRLGPGEAARRLGLFVTVDETDPAPELVELKQPLVI